MHLHIYIYKRMCVCIFLAVSKYRKKIKTSIKFIIIESIYP